MIDHFLRFDNDETNTLKNCDIVIWIGDLNYRVSEDEITGEEIRALAEKWEIGPLLRFVVQHAHWIAQLTLHCGAIYFHDFRSFGVRRQRIILE